MPRRFKTDHEALGETEATADLVLGAPALLGIFFAAALLCAVCFGFGYSSGRIPHATPLVESDQTAPEQAAPPGGIPDVADAAAQPSENNTSPQDSAGGIEPGFPPQDNAGSASKPAPGMRYASPDTPPAGLAAAETQDLPASRRTQTSQSTGMADAAGAAGASPTPYTTTRRPFTGAAGAAAAVPAPAAANSAVAEPATAAPGSAAPAMSLMVQIAAVTHAADAETLASALRHDGFAATVRTTTGDPYFHVQIGPFASLQAARAMRAKLAGSGYNAFIRP